MAKIRAGIEIPIIPEDFVVSEPDQHTGMPESLSKRPDPDFQDELFPTEWIITETFFYQYPKG
jgi:hypothetical protein